ncbi:MAG: DUF2505 family protein [Byssovorax sp.]
MIKFAITDDINCNVQNHWKLFVNQEINDKIFLGFMAFKVLSNTEDSTQIVRKVQCSPTAKLPEPVATFVGANFNFVESGRLDKSTNVWTYSQTPSAFADQLKVYGTVEAVSTGTNTVRRTANVVVEANVFGIGGAIEAFMQAQWTAAWQAGATFTNKWIADGNPI